MAQPSDPTSSAAASPARTSATQESASASTASDRASGRSLRESFAFFDPASSSWRTSQLSLIAGSTASSVTWPRSGSMRNGTCFERPTSGRPISEHASSCLPTPTASTNGYNRGGGMGRVGPIRPSLWMMALTGLWPTPVAADCGRGSSTYARGNLTLTGAVKLFPTPTVCGNRNRKGASKTSDNGLATAVAASGRGQLNPTWVEWLMGFPTGHTDCDFSETPSSRRKRRSPGGL